MINLPIEYLNNMRSILKDEYDDYLNCFNNDRYYGLRINTKKISVKEFLKINPFDLVPIPWCDDGFYFNPKQEPSKHPYYYAGLYYIQEPSAMLPAMALDVKENDYVLDACAAPGGKSIKLANKLNNTGVLISNDISVSRAQVLLKVLENQGIENAFVIAEDIEKINGQFNKILVDAPCSGEGMFRKDNDLIKNWDINSNNYYSKIQKQIIKKTITLLKDGGQLVYSTCTFNPKENEEVIEYALSICSELKVLPIKKHNGFCQGLTDNTKNCVRLYPHKIKGEGHFVCLLQKGNEIKNEFISKKEITNDNILLNNIKKKFYNGKFVNRENRLYFEPDCFINLRGHRVLKSGLLLGKIKHSKFIPSQALAMALHYEEYDNILSFNLDDDRVIKYLKCETLDVKDKHLNGLVLVCIEKYPLGFGKVDKGILKNMYPANYRYK